MTQLELQAFLAVTRTGSFSQAAQSLFISQPALSRRIRTLEEELGFRLLERQKGARSVEPTQEGRAFTPVAEHWLTLWEEARSIPQREENQVFRVASVGSVSTYILAPVLQRFLLDGTSSLTFHQYHSLESYGYVERGEVDLAFISDGSALFLLAGYNYMPSGVATTIHFMYPVVTAVVMMLFYHEARRLSTLLAVGMAVLGVTALSWPSGSDSVSLWGVVIVLISAVCYALYIIRVNRSRAHDMEAGKLTFYVMLFGALIFGAEALRQHQLQPLTTLSQAGHLFALACVCTVVTNLCVVGAVKRIGSTMVAVLGAFEPLTAVVVGSLVFSEPFTLKVLLGVSLIIPAVVLIISWRTGGWKQGARRMYGRGYQSFAEIQSAIHCPTSFVPYACPPGA